MVKSIPSNTHNNTLFKKSLIAIAVLGVSSQSFAQESEQFSSDQDADNVSEVEVIEVKGTRRNAISAQDIKLNAETLVDALSAEDMGSLPDRSVLEAISRLPGVALERFAGANDPDHFGVEGGGVVVRGLGQVRTEFNGRDSFSADASGNGLSFEDVSPELIGSVTIFKNQSADMIEGGIAGTVSLNTRKPFDSDGRKIAFSGDLTYTDLREETAPTFSALFSDTWDLDSGARLGFLASFSNSKIKVLSDGTQTGLYKVDGLDDTKFAATGARITRKNDNRERRGFASSVQFESADKTLLVTGEYIRSQAIAKWNEYVSETDAGVNPSAYGATFDTIGNGDSYFDDGIINTSSGNGVTQIFQTRVREEDSVVSDYSLNVKFTPNDTWSFQYDLQFIDSDKEVIDHSIMGAASASVSLTQNGNGLPDIGFFQGDYTGGEVPTGTPFQDESKYFYRSAMDHAQDNEGDELSTKFDAKYTFDDGIVESISAGVRYAKRELTSRDSTFNWANLSESWGNNGRRYHYNETPGLPPVDNVSFDDFAGGGVFSGQGGNSFLFPSVDLARNLDTNADVLIGALTNPDGNRAPQWVPLAQRTNAIAGSKFLPTEINETEETNTAAYVKLNFANDIGDMFLKGNVGLRYVKLENDAVGFDTFESINTNLSTFPAAQQDFLNGGTNNNVASGDYSTVLPSLNLALSVTEELIVRFAFSQAISKPSLEDLRNFKSIRGKEEFLNEVFATGDDPNDPQAVPISSEYTEISGEGGNADLQPMESTNFDLALEYYFDEASSATLTFFHKDLKNYFINGNNTIQLTNNGVTQDVNYATTTNGDSGSVNGYEISYTQFYDDLPGAWGGLGTQLNYTRIVESGSPSPDNELAVDLPLEGLSGHNANASFIYEKDKISARVAYNWRSRYLLTSEDVITGLPIFNEANGSLDASFFYEVNEIITVGLQGTNLNNNVTQTLMQVNDAGDLRTRSHFVSDRRYSLVVKGNF